MRTCPRCKRNLSNDEFSKNKTRPNGLHVYCRDCAKEWQREYRKKKTEGYRKTLRRRYLKKRDQDHAKSDRRERYKKWYDKNREQVLALSKKYRDANKHKRKAWDAVKAAIRRNDLPAPDGLVCEHCQEAQAKEYHHHSYEPEFHLDVVALCRECHGIAHRRI